MFREKNLLMTDVEFHTIEAAEIDSARDNSKFDNKLASLHESNISFKQTFHSYS